MTALHRARPLYRPLLLAGLALGCALPVLQPGRAAALAACYTDPIVRLSNGVTVQIQGIIGTEASNIGVINYTVHAPSGVSMVSVRFLDTVASKEHVVLKADQPAGSYATDTVVNTRGLASVTVMTTLTSVSTATSVTGEATGEQAQRLHVQFAY